MREFISIFISFIFMSLANSIDSSFNNLISIDAIVVTSSFLLLDLIFKSVGEIGIYTYRTIRKNEWKYLNFNIIFSFISGLIILLFKDIIVDAFSLSIVQKSMLSSLLNLYIPYVVLGRLANSIFEMIRLKGNIKLYNKSLIVYYISLIGLDMIAYLFTKNLNLLIVATIVSWIISIIYMLYNLKIKFELPDNESLKNVIKYGVLYSFERIFSRIFILLYGVLASHLSTNDYAIHSICYAVCLNLETITNAYNAALMIKIPEGKTYNEQKRMLEFYMKKCFVLIIILNILFSMIYLFISHGSLPIFKCFPYIIFYSTACLGLFFYESYKTLLVVKGQIKVILFGSISGVVIRFLVCLIFFKTPIALYIFGLANMIDFYFRSLIYKHFSHRIS